MAKNETMAALLCKQVALPKNANVMRLPGPRPSAVANPFRKPPMNWSTPPPLVQQLLPADEAMMIVTNDPLCACIYTDKNPNSILLQQIWTFGGPLGVGNPQLINVTPGQTPDLDNDLFCSVPNVGVRNWHGPALFARLFKGKYWMWCDASTTPSASSLLTIATGAGLGVGDAVNITIFRLNEYDEIPVFSARVAGPIPGGGPVTAFQLPAADYYRVVLAGDDDNTSANLTFTITNQCTSEIMIHLPLPDLVERQMNLTQAIRVTGAASHAINLVSEQNATGSWIGDQPESGVCWTAYLRGIGGANGYQKLSSQQGDEFMELKKFNPYTFVVPEDEDDWDYSHAFTFNSSSGVTNIINKPMNEFHYTIVYFKSGGTTITADASRNLQLEFFYCVEYTTDGLWPMVGTSPLTEDDKAAAIKVLASLENITHNPGWKEILSSIGKYVRLSAPVLALMGPYGKAASVAATGIGEALTIFDKPGKRARTRQQAHQEAEGYPGEGGVTGPKVHQGARKALRVEVLD